MDVSPIKAIDAMHP
jgi:hypothetical protein